MAKDPEQYYRDEWDLFQRSQVRWNASLIAAGARPISRVLDVGCGAGQEMLPFVVHRKAFAIGVDPSADAIRIGSLLHAQIPVQGNASFARASGESLPFKDSVFDVVICRLALPYMDNRKTLKEMTRVLNPEGILILRIHHFLYYIRDFFDAIRARNVRNILHALRTLMAGSVYHITNWQPRNRWFGYETFQSRWQLLRELKPLGFTILREQPTSNSSAPIFIIGRSSDSLGD